MGLFLALAVTACGTTEAPGLSSAKAMTAYSLDGVSGEINETAKTIAVTMPFGKDVTALVATFTTTGAGVAVGGAAQQSGTTANDFTSPVAYTVVAADSTSAKYTVTVTVASDSAKALTAFTLDAIAGVIDETAKTIAVPAPFETSVTAMVATFATTGASVKVGEAVQVSGTTANDFTSPVTYTVTAADGTSAAYVVTVTIAASSAKAITVYSLEGRPGAINQAAKTIAVTMPYATQVTALVASFTTTGTSVKVGEAVQTSGTTPNDFTNPVTYTVTAADGTTETYTVTVAVALSPSKAMSAYSLDGTPGSLDDVAKTISVSMPYGTAVSALVATFTTTGASVKVVGVEQVSGTTVNDFTNPVLYTVTAADGTTAIYTVNVDTELNTTKALASYSLNGVAGMIDEATKTIAVTLQPGTSVTALVATFTTTGASVKVGTEVQISGATANDFTNPVEYLVTAEDGSSVTYTVTATVALTSAKAMTSFGLGAAGGRISRGSINELAKTITVTRPFGSSVTALVATFTTTGASVRVGGVVQTSGTTENDFTNSVVYTVTAADNSTVTYAVTVSLAANTAKAITEFGLGTLSGKISTGAIDEGNKTISVTRPHGSDVTALVATFTTTGATVTVGDVEQTSGSTPNDFTNPVTYTVTAGDGSSANYVVTVSLALNSAKAIASFALGTKGTILSTGVINEGAKTIAVTRPFGSAVTALIAAFSTTGASVKVNGVLQSTGATANDFTNPVAYLVTAEDGSSVTYTVTVTIAQNWAKAITDFGLGTLNGKISTGTINEDAKTIAVTRPYNSSVIALVATFTTTGVSVAVGELVQTSGKDVNDFTKPVIYTVTAEDGSTVDYTVTVTVALNPAKAITSFSLCTHDDTTRCEPTNSGAGSIDETKKTIAVTMPYGTNVSPLYASFVTTGVSVYVGHAIQKSGTTANDFTSPLAYRVYAADESTVTYTVTVTVAQNSAKAITKFWLCTHTSSTRCASSESGSGVIDEAKKTIAVTMPYGTKVSPLYASFVTSGVSVYVGDAIQTSGVTPNDFRSSVLYTVTAADASFVDYTVTVTVALNPAKAITYFAVLGYPGVIAESAVPKTIAVVLPFGGVYKKLNSATFRTTGASVKVGGTEQVSGETLNDFFTSPPVVYTVTAADGTTATYNVTVNVAPSVTAVAPTVGATGVALRAVISATFSEAMDPATMVVGNFTVCSTTVTVCLKGTVAYAVDSKTLTFTPTGGLASGTTYTATILKAARDLQGATMASDYVWTFATR